MEQKRNKRSIPLLLEASPLHHPIHWKEKLRKLIESTSSRNSLETLGKELSTEQILELIDWAASKNNSSSRDTVDALFAGLKQSVFYTLLTTASPLQLDFLKKDSFVETIQHHLSQLSHELKSRFHQFCEVVLNEEKAIETLDLSNLRSEDLEIISHTLRALAEQGQAIVHVTASALALAWNTNRTDLIQELSQTKELCQQCLIKNIGTSKSEDSVSSGLWKTLEKKLNSVFTDLDTDGNVIMMKDTDFALEALVKFSVWHLRDYCEVGLLPHTDEEIPMEHRENLFALAEKNLAKLGLKTLHDLKNAKIYSKRALIEYISASKEIFAHSKTSCPH